MSTEVNDDPVAPSEAQLASARQRALNGMKQRGSKPEHPTGSATTHEGATSVYADAPVLSSGGTAGATGVAGAVTPTQTKMAQGRRKEPKVGLYVCPTMRVP